MKHVKYFIKQSWSLSEESYWLFRPIVFICFAIIVLIVVDWEDLKTPSRSD